MKKSEQKKALAVAVKAARSAGRLIQQNLRATKTINSQTQYDIKLELDVRCQKLIEKILLRAFPKTAILGEEGVSGDQNAATRWVLDPIDGTVNFTYGIPHACISIALQEKAEVGSQKSGDGKPASRPKPGRAEYKSIVGVIYDPFCNELWTAVRGDSAKLNGKIVRVSNRRKLSEAVVSIGFAKSKETVRKTLPYFNRLAPRIRKIRMMGAAALGLVYVASGRFDAYVEGGIKLWDIAAGGLILECAGGEFWNEPVDHQYTYRIIANNGLLRRQLAAI